MADYILSCCSTVDTSVEWCNERDISYIYFNYQLDGVALKDDFGKTKLTQIGRASCRERV